MDLQELGRSAYKRKDFDKALEYFNRAMARAQTTQLLDNRAATFERLSDLSAALKDAKRAIQLYKQDPTGYLRAGRVLVKMEKQSVALEIYAYGLKSVKPEGEGFKVLRKVHGDLLSQLSPPTSVDPFTMLPREIGEMILEYLTFRQRINCCRVSKQWTGFVRSCPNLWSDLDLSGARRIVRNSFVSRAINTARSKIVRASLNKMQDVDKAMAALIRNCSVREIELIGAGLQSQGLVDYVAKAKTLSALRLGAGTEIGLDAASRLLPLLEVFGCRHMTKDIAPSLWRGKDLSKLRELELEGGHAGYIEIDSLAISAPNLTKLKLHQGTGSGIRIGDISMLTRLENLELYGSILMPNDSRLPKGIRVLSIDASGNMQRYQDFTGWYLPRLEELNLTLPSQNVFHLVELAVLGDAETTLDVAGHDGSSAAHASETIEEKKTPAKLEKLSIARSGVHIAGDPDIARFLSNPRLSELKHVRLPHAGVHFTDATLQSIAAVLPQLITIDISGTDVTGIGLKTLVQRSSDGRLEHVTVNDCRKLGADAVEWARAQGVGVEYKMNDFGSGGKKLRY